MIHSKDLGQCFRSIDEGSKLVAQNESVCSAVDKAKFNALVNAHATLPLMLQEADDPHAKRKRETVNESVNNRNKKNKEQSLDNDTLMQCQTVVSSDLILQLLDETCREKNSDLNQVGGSYLAEGIQRIVRLYENSDEYEKDIEEMAKLIDILITGRRFTAQQISHIILTNTSVDYMPLTAIWKFSELGVLSFEKVLDRMKYTDNMSRLLKTALQIILENNTENNNDDVIRTFLTSLITISYSLPKTDYAALQQCSNKLLLDLTHKILEHIENANSQCQNQADEAVVTESAEPKYHHPIMNICDIILQASSLSANALEQFLTSHLVAILTYKPNVPVSIAIKEQEKWRSTKRDKHLSTIMFSIIVGIGHTMAFSTLDTVVSSLEVNWSYVLTFLSTLLLAYPESSAKVRALIDRYLQKGCSSLEIEFLILGFLFARHASQEGRHIFPTYSQWFGAVFGSQNLSPANTKMSFIFLFQFLTDLVPFESPSSLRAHIHQSVYVPKGCQSVLRDYQHLARAQIQHLTNQPNAQYFDEGQTTADLTDHQKVLDEVTATVEQFEKLQQVPSFLIESSIFKRSYFLNTFLPALLKPRCLPSEPDSKMKLIAQLLQLQKIPKRVYQSYCDGCQRAAAASVTAQNAGYAKDFRPLSPLEDLLQDILNNKINKKPADEARVLELLSQISYQLEVLTSVADLKYKNATSLVIEALEYSPQTVLYQIIHTFIDITKKLYSSVNTVLDAKNKNGIGQLLSLLTVSPALQAALVITLMSELKRYPEGKVAFDEMNFYGVLLAELKTVEEMFLPVRPFCNTNEESYRIVNFIINNLPMDSAKECVVSCFYLSAMISRTHREGSSCNLKEALPLYACLAPRLTAMRIEWRQMNIPCIPVKGLSGRIAVENNHIPLCCQFFFEQEELFAANCPTLEEWLKFELDTPWDDTPLDFRMRHLHHWFLNYYVKGRFSHGKGKSSNSLQCGFLRIFWSLVNINSNSGNAAEIMILLQGLSEEEGCELSLIEEWKKWKRRTYSHPAEGNTEMNHKMELRISYHTKLLSFLSLCRCLPRNKFFNGSNMLQCSSLLKEMVYDLLDCKGSMYLEFGDCLFFFEALMKSCHQSESSSAYIQHCFNSIKDSVLFHWKFLKIMMKNLPVVKLPYMNLLSKLDTDDYQTWKTLDPSDQSVVISSILYNKEHTYISNLNVTINDGNKVCALFRCVSLLGNTLLKRSEADYFPAEKFCFKGKSNLNSRCNVSPDLILASDDDDDEGISTNKAEEQESDKMDYTRCLLSFCLYILSRFEHGVVDPLKLMTVLKKGCECIPGARRTSLLGLVFILLARLWNPLSTSGGEAAWYLSLLISCFNLHAKLFEVNEDEFFKESDSLSYLCRLNKEILTLLETMPKNVIQLMPETVLNSCDSELKVIISRHS